MPKTLRAAALAVLVILLGGCGAGQVRPAPGRLASWTAELRDSQPEDAFAAVYKIGRRRLVFVGAQHSQATGSSTFRLIAEAYAGFDIDTVIVEGFATSRGANAERLLAYAARTPDKDGFQEAGETAPAVLGAVKEGAAFWGGEPDDTDVKGRLLLEQISAQDLLGYYTLRSIPQWVGERRIDNAGDSRLPAFIDAELARNRERLAVEPTLLPDYAAWASWYRAKNGKSIGADFAIEEVGPLTDGRFGTNRIAAAISRVRDAYLHNLIVDHLNAGETVLVVFGASHLMIHRPALDSALGRPCYSGPDLKAAPARCAGR